MDTLKRLHENISALKDGELSDGELELALAALDSTEGRAAWQAYQLIGDSLREQAAGAVPGEAFSARLAARLAAEPALGGGLAPRSRKSKPEKEPPLVSLP